MNRTWTPDEWNRIEQAARAHLAACACLQGNYGVSRKVMREVKRATALELRQWARNAGARGPSAPGV